MKGMRMGDSRRGERERGGGRESMDEEESGKREREKDVSPLNTRRRIWLRDKPDTEVYPPYLHSEPTYRALRSETPRCRRRVPGEEG